MIIKKWLSLLEAMYSHTQHLWEKRWTRPLGKLWKAKQRETLISIQKNGYYISSFPFFHFGASTHSFFALQTLLFLHRGQSPLADLNLWQGVTARREGRDEQHNSRTQGREESHKHRFRRWREEEKRFFSKKHKHKQQSPKGRVRDSTIFQKWGSQRPSHTTVINDTGGKRRKEWRRKGKQRKRRKIEGIDDPTFL